MKLSTVLLENVVRLWWLGKLSTVLTCGQIEYHSNEWENQDCFCGQIEYSFYGQILLSTVQWVIPKDGLGDSLSPSPVGRVPSPRPFENICPIIPPLPATKKIGGSPSKQKTPLPRFSWKLGNFPEHKCKLNGKFLNLEERDYWCEGLESEVPFWRVGKLSTVFRATWARQIEYTSDEWANWVRFFGKV